MSEPTANPNAAAPTSQPPVIGPGYTLGSVTDKISAIVLKRPYSRSWILGFGVAFLLTNVLLIAVTYVSANLLVDMAYGFLDPRIRRE